MLFHNLLRCRNLCAPRNPLLNLLPHLRSLIRRRMATTTDKRYQQNKPQNFHKSFCCLKTKRQAKPAFEFSLYSVISSAGLSGCLPETIRLIKPANAAPSGVMNFYGARKESLKHRRTILLSETGLVLPLLTMRRTNTTPAEYAHRLRLRIAMPAFHKIKMINPPNAQNPHPAGV